MSTPRRLSSQRTESDPIEAEYCFQPSRFANGLLYQVLGRGEVSVMDAKRGNGSQENAAPLDQMSRRRFRRRSDGHEPKPCDRSADRQEPPPIDSILHERFFELIPLCLFGFENGRPHRIGSIGFGTQNVVARNGIKSDNLPALFGNELVGRLPI